MTARRIVRGIAAAALVVAVLGGGAALLGALPIAGIGSDGSAAAATETPELATVPVERRTMTVEETLDGTLGFGGQRRVTNNLAGTVTRLPGIGSVLERGDPLYELDGRMHPILMYGSRPAWRTLDEDSDDGADISQLEANLEALGYLAAGEGDRAWDDETTEAVEAWQEASGNEVDGVVDLGEVVFLYGPIRVTEHAAELGARVGPGQPVLLGTSDERVVTLELEADRSDLLAGGDEVTLELPDGRTTPGTVSAIGTVAEASTDEFGQPGTPTVEVTIGLDDPTASAAWDQAPVTVEVVRESREDLLAVPVNALLALLEGGYAVEVLAEDGRSRLLGVELGIFQDGWVEIRVDGLEAGDQVVVPS